MEGRKENYIVAGNGKKMEGKLLVLMQYIGYESCFNLASSTICSSVLHFCTVCYNLEWGKAF